MASSPIDRGNWQTLGHVEFVEISTESYFSVVYTEDIHLFYKVFNKFKGSDNILIYNNINVLVSNTYYKNEKSDSIKG